MVTSNPVTTSNRASNTAETCGNCGAPLTGRYCAACGQSREDICRPIWSLLTDTLDGLLSWDGRILTTFRHLYTRPGRVARDYVGGKRASFTPPVRLYIIASVIFFAAISLSGVRIVAVETTASAGGPSSIFLTIFQRPRSEAARALSPEDQAAVLERAREQGVADVWQNAIVDAMTHPELLEDRASAASGQALILMVFVFALMSLILPAQTGDRTHRPRALFSRRRPVADRGACPGRGLYTPALAGIDCGSRAHNPGSRVRGRAV